MPDKQRLFNPGQVGLAAFFGGPIGGLVAMVLNFLALGQQKVALAWAFLGMFVLTLPDAFRCESGLIDALARILWVTLCMVVAERYQGRAISCHDRGSSLSAICVGLGVMVLRYAAYWVVWSQHSGHLP